MHKDIYRKFVAINGENVISEQMAREWCNIFNEDRVEFLKFDPFALQLPTTTINADYSNLSNFELVQKSKPQ